VAGDLSRAVERDGSAGVPRFAQEDTSYTLPLDDLLTLAQFSRKKRAGNGAALEGPVHSPVSCVGPSNNAVQDDNASFTRNSPLPAVALGRKNCGTSPLTPECVLSLSAPVRLSPS